MSSYLYADEYGSSGDPILLLHGLGGGASVWAPVAEQLASDHRILAPDLLGFGRSPWPDVTYSVDDHLMALMQLLEDKGLATGQIDVAGHSMGAVLAAELAARHPDLVRGMALVNLPYFRSEVEVRDIAKRLGLLARLTVGDHWGARVACGIMCSLRPMLIFLAPYLTKRVPANVAQDALRHNFTSYSRSLQNVVIRHRLDPALTALADRTVLLIHGEDDRVVPVENVRSLARQFPNWRLEALTEAGHLLPVERSKQIAGLLTRTYSPSS